MDFVKVMREAKRMYKFYEGENMHKTDFFKEGHVLTLEGWLEFGFENPERFQEIVKAWSDANPRPIYPSFRELIQYMCDISGRPDLYTKLPAAELLDAEVPPQAAEQYGLMPLNECGLTKYVEGDMESEWR